jgi:hypothetical protein
LGHAGRQSQRPAPGLSSFDGLSGPFHADDKRLCGLAKFVTGISQRQSIDPTSAPLRPQGKVKAKFQNRFAAGAAAA